MKRKRFSDEQSIGILEAAEVPGNIRSAWKERNLSEPVCYRWRDKYGGMDVSEATESWLREYNYERLHGSLGGRTALMVFKHGNPRDREAAGWPGKTPNPTAGSGLMGWPEADGNGAGIQSQSSFPKGRCNNMDLPRSFASGEDFLRVRRRISRTAASLVCLCWFDMSTHSLGAQTPACVSSPRGPASPKPADALQPEGAYLGCPSRSNESVVRCSRPGAFGDTRARSRNSMSRSASTRICSACASPTDTRKHSRCWAPGSAMCSCSSLASHSDKFGTLAASEAGAYSSCRLVSSAMPILGNSKKSRLEIPSPSQDVLIAISVYLSART
jgi:hypothetical protein